MPHLSNPFRKLAWKLTFTYTLVTVAALMVVEVLVVGVLLVFTANRLPEITVQVVARDLAPLVRPYLASDPPDVAGLTAWLQWTSVNGIPISAQGGPRITFPLGGHARDHGQLLVLDRDGKLLASSTASASEPSTSLAEIPDLDRLLPAALSGESDLSSLSSDPATGHLTVAAPVLTDSGQVLGVLVFTGPSFLGGSLEKGLVLVITCSLLAFTLAAGTIGTVFGFFTARGLTRRLQRVAQTASAWGQGKFSETIVDNSADELGQLAGQLNEMAGQLEWLVQTRQQLAGTEERNRLARDLHDTVKQQVFAISMNLGAAKATWEANPAGARERLEAAASLALQTQQELSVLIQTLRPMQLEGRDLAQALRDYSLGWDKQSGVAVVLKIPADLPLPDDVEDALFRVVQEALSNIVRHSGATAASISLTAHAAEVYLQITDNGRGFDPGFRPNRQNPGMGLRSMDERVRNLGGELRLESSAHGTSVSVTIPLYAKEASAISDKRAGSPLS